MNLRIVLGRMLNWLRRDTEAPSVVWLHNSRDGKCTPCFAWRTDSGEWLAEVRANDPPIHTTAAHKTVHAAVQAANDWLDSQEKQRMLDPLREHHNLDWDKRKIVLEIDGARYTAVPITSQEQDRLHDQGAPTVTLLDRAFRLDLAQGR